MKFSYEHDCGATTELGLKVVSEREGHVGTESVIMLVARDDPPSLLCICCGKMQPKCVLIAFGKETRSFCDDCAEEHECGKEMLLPGVNSPRVGMVYGIERSL